LDGGVFFDGILADGGFSETFVDDFGECGMP